LVVSGYPGATSAAHARLSKTNAGLVQSVVTTRLTLSLFQTILAVIQAFELVIRLLEGGSISKKTPGLLSLAASARRIPVTVKPSWLPTPARPLMTY
jgi:hypothetical protein